MKKVPNLTERRKARERFDRWIAYETWLQSSAFGWNTYKPMDKCECGYCGTMNQPELQIDNDCAGCSAPIAA